jgi:predicted NAD-dependent protein-ADP-ribosyltransferase YbiA (DUF1768 family)
MTTDPILFFKSDQPYYEFTNFYKPGKLEIDGKTWLTTEHYFQAMKFYDLSSMRHTEYMEIIRLSDGPMKAAILGRQKQKGGFAGDWKVNKVSDLRTLNDVIKTYPDVGLRADWESAKDDIMRKALQAKFTQNADLKKLLKETGNRKIIEASPKDAYWGWGRDKKGKNMLGLLLEEFRGGL